MPGVHQHSGKEIAGIAQRAHESGVQAVLLFGIPKSKDEQASGAYAENGVVQNAVRQIKKHAPDLTVITDVCLCEYTSHGHCGVTRLDGQHFHVLNDESVELIAKTAVSHAAAGADLVAPSDMMDGRIGAIRRAFEEHQYTRTGIMAYSAKYASCFYGPFRDALDSAPGFGDKKTYQMDPANRLEAVKEAIMDVEEGADIVMVKPALPYLDIIREVKNAVRVPVSAYNISGEYALIKAAAKMGWINEEKAILETLTSIKRAGADLIATYFAKDAVKLLHV